MFGVRRGAFLIAYYFSVQVKVLIRTSSRPKRTMNSLLLYYFNIFYTSSVLLLLSSRPTDWDIWVSMIDYGVGGRSEPSDIKVGSGASGRAGGDASDAQTGEGDAARCDHQPTCCMMNPPKTSTRMP